MRGGAKARRRIAVGLGASLALGLAALILGRSVSTPRAPTATFVSQLARQRIGARCDHAYTSLSTIAARHPGEALVPDTPLAGRQNVRHLIWCPEPDVVQVYDSGVWITVGPNKMRDPARTFAQTAEQNPGVTLTTINGDLAIQADPAQDPSGRLPGGVEFVHDGIDIGVYGNGTITLSELLAVARSIAPYR